LSQGSSNISNGGQGKQFLTLFPGSDAITVNSDSAYK